jgi:hypothetical protein
MPVLRRPRLKVLPRIRRLRFAALHRVASDGSYVIDCDMVPGSSIPAYYQLTSDGYVVELLVPANASIGFMPGTCTPFALQVEVYDRDGGIPSTQLRYQVFREGAVALVHHYDYQCDFPTGEGTGGLGAFASLVMAESLGEDCNHAPTVETMPIRSSASATRRSDSTSAAATAIATASR